MGNKQIYINEENLNVLGNKKYLLPKFLYSQLQKHQTSLGDNPAFPPETGQPFDYTVIKRQYKEIIDDVISNFGEDMLDVENVKHTISKMLKLCKDMERPIHPQLEKIAYNAINKLFAIPEGVIVYDCKLVDKIVKNKGVRITPENSDAPEYTFDDIDDMKLSSNAIAKRRLINSLIQGGAYELGSISELYAEDLNEINPELLPLYEQIMLLSQYLLFAKKERISDKDTQQGAFVEVRLGGAGRCTEIHAQGIIFPLMLNELIRGFLEQFSSYGLPKDMKKAQYIVRNADFILAEPWDMRFGRILWKKAMPNKIDTNAIPYYFKEICSLPFDDFNFMMQESFAGTRKGDGLKEELIGRIKYNIDYQDFINNINAKNVDKSLINDGYFSAEELDSFFLDGDDETASDEILTDEVDIEEEESIVENQENEYLDKEYMKPLYDYLRNGQRYSSDGYLHPSKQLVVPFFEYAMQEMDDNDFKVFKKALRENPRLQNKIRTLNRFDGRRYIECYSQMSNGLEKVPMEKFLRQNATQIFNITYNQDATLATLWDKFMIYVNDSENISFLKKNQDLEADTVLMNPQLTKPQWLIHFTSRKSDALSILSNGFTRGSNISQMKNLGYTNKDWSSKKDGKFCYAYNAQQISDSTFPTSFIVDKEHWRFDNNFDQKTWERAIHYAIMFRSSGVEAFHYTDRENQVIFNADNARDFILLAYSYNNEPLNKDMHNKGERDEFTRRMNWNVIGKDSSTVYSNHSITNVVRWVINNFDQYRKTISN